MNAFRKHVGMACGFIGLLAGLACEDVQGPQVESTDTNLSSSPTSIAPNCPSCGIVDPSSPLVQSELDRRNTASLYGRSFKLVGLAYRGVSQPVVNELQDAILAFDLVDEPSLHTGLHDLSASAGQPLRAKVVANRLQIDDSLIVPQADVAGLEATAAINQERWLLHMLRYSPNISIGQHWLFLSQAEIQTIWLDRRQALDPLPWANTLWHATTFSAASGVETTQTALVTPATLSFNEADGTWSAFDGCVLGSGTFKRAGIFIDFLTATYADGECTASLEGITSQAFRRVVAMNTNATIENADHHMWIRTAEFGIRFNALTVAN